MQRTDMYTGESYGSPDFYRTTNMPVQMTYTPGVNGSTIRINGTAQPVQPQPQMQQQVPYGYQNIPTYGYQQQAPMQSPYPYYTTANGFPQILPGNQQPQGFNQGYAPVGFQPQQPMYGYQQPMMQQPQPYYGGVPNQYGNNAYYGNMQQQPYMNMGNGYMGNRGTPINLNPMQQQQPSGPTTIPGFNPSGNPVLISQEMIDKVNKLQEEMNAEIRDAQVNFMKAKARRNRGDYEAFGYDANGLLTGWQGDFALQNQVATIQQKYLHMVEDMRKEAVQNRINLNKKLSKMCRKASGQDASDEAIDKVYEEKQIKYAQHAAVEHQKDIVYGQFNTYIHSLIPVTEFNNPYAKHFFDCQRFHDAYVNPKDNMQEFFRDLRQLHIAEDLAKEQERRKHLGAGTLYNANDFNILLADTIVKNSIKNKEKPLYGDIYSMPKEGLNADVPPVASNIVTATDGSFVVNGKKYPIQEDDAKPLPVPDEENFPTLHECATIDPKTGELCITLPERFGKDSKAQGNSPGSNISPQQISEDFKNRNQQIISGSGDLSNTLSTETNRTLSKLATIVESQRDGFLKALYGPRPKGGGYLEGYKPQG